MANGWTIIIGMVLVIVFSAVAWVASPKGENQTTWRSSLILSAWSMWLMWAITLLMQLHPLIAPERNDLRPENLHRGVPS